MRKCNTNSELLQAKNFRKTHSSFSSCVFWKLPLKLWKVAFLWPLLQHLVTAIDKFPEPAFANLCRLYTFRSLLSSHVNVARWRRQKFWLAPGERPQKPKGPTSGSYSACHNCLWAEALQSVSFYICSSLLPCRANVNTTVNSLRKTIFSTNATNRQAIITQIK